MGGGIIPTDIARQVPREQHADQMLTAIAAIVRLFQWIAGFHVSGQETVSPVCVTAK